MIEIMKQTHAMLLTYCIFILFLLSIHSSLFAERQQQSSAIIPITLHTYPGYYHNTNTGEPLTIFYPRSLLPVILVPEQSFIIQFHSISFNKVTATITTANDPLPNTISLNIGSISQEEEVIYATATIPAQTPIELYNITLIIEVEGETYTATSPRSVSVKQSIYDSYTFVHLTDFHIGDPRGIKENPQETIGWKAARKVIQEINLLQPDFVLITGDLTFGQFYPFEYSVEYKKCYEILQEFDVPTYLCPGNHDGYVQTGQDGLRLWEQFFGPLYYSFDYANSHFVSINSYDWSYRDRIGFSYLVFNWGGSIRQEQMDWIENDLLSNTEADHTIMMVHHNPLWDIKGESLLKKGFQGRDDILTLIRTKGVDTVLAGHVHFDNITIDNDTIYITTTTPTSYCDEDGYWGYRIITIDNNTLTSCNYIEPKYSIPSYQINILEQTKQSITIKNDLRRSIPVILEFIVPYDDYFVNQGTIIQTRKLGAIVAVYVSTTINAQTTETIMLY